MTAEGYKGPLKEEKVKLKKGKFLSGSLITTETRRPLCSGTAEVSSIEDDMKRARVEVIQFVKELVSDIESRLGSDVIVNLMRKTFEDFSSTALAKLLTNTGHQQH